MASARKRLTLPHDAYSMIGEFRVHLRQLVLRHVAGDAILIAHRAGWRGVCDLRRLRVRVRCVTLQASLIIRTQIMHQRSVRIVAGEASQSRVAAFAPALAGLHTIGLKAYRESSRKAGHGDIPFRAVAPSAELHRSDWTKPARIKEQLSSLLEIFGLHCRGVLRARSMTSFAAHTGNHMCEVKSIAGGGSRGMAAETVLSFFRVQRPASRVREFA